MKRVSLFFAMLFLLHAVAAQDIKSENLQNFSKVLLSGKMNVTLEKSDSNSIEIKLINSDISKVDWSIKSSLLTIRLRPTPLNDSGSADVKIYYTDITAIDVRSGANVRFANAVDYEIFTASINSGANLAFEFNGSDLTVNAEGNSAANIKGTTDYLTVKATTMAKVDARDLQAKSVIAATSINSEIFVWGTEKLDAKAVTNSVIYYKGTPPILKTKGQLMGTVEQFSY